MICDRFSQFFRTHFIYSETILEQDKYGGKSERWMNPKREAQLPPSPSLPTPPLLLPSNNKYPRSQIHLSTSLYFSPSGVSLSRSCRHFERWIVCFFFKRRNNDTFQTNRPTSKFRSKMNGLRLTDFTRTQMEIKWKSR